MSPVRIGNASGFYGDRLSAMREMLEGGELDYLTGDYLAELTMLILGRDRMKDPALGYAKTFVRQMQDCMSLAKDKGVRIVTNAGGLNPSACAEKLREIAAEQGLDISIAHVEGDDLVARASELGFGNVVTANAYLGAFGIAAALEEGADIVVTGRVTDASVIVGPAIAHFGWGREDYDKLASAVVAGHVIECGTQASGGNFSGFTSIELGLPGFPLVEIDEDGSLVITKHPATSGEVTVDTVTAQLVYEITGGAYLGPDVTTHFDTMTLSQEAPDRVAVTGVTGSAPPDTAKVCLNTIGGFRNSVEFILTGLDIEEKAALVRSQMDAAMEASGKAPDVVEWQLDRTDVEDPATQAAATTLLRLHVKSAGPDPVGRAFTSAAIELALASYPGFAVTRPPAAGTPYGIYRPAFVPQDQVPHVVVLADGRHLDIAPPVVTVSGAEAGQSAGEAREPGRGEAAERARGTSAVRVPLGRLTFARSGDKGGDANVGLWIPAGHPRREEAYAWLEHLLDEKTVRQLLPEAAELDIEIYPLANIRAVNIVIHGLLGEGVAASTRFDPQAKALGEWIRARFVELPKSLVPGPHSPAPQSAEEA
ncbi:MAG: acyclic terpene utilization AtuA family protein [Aeromicrobium sp.]